MSSDYFNYTGALVGGAIFLWIFYLALIALSIVSMWKIFVKAGKPGWAVLVPFYNLWVELEILGRPWWFLLLILFVPIANVVVAIMLIFDFARVFGKSVGFGFGLLFLPIIFFPILAFSSAKYVAVRA